MRAAVPLAVICGVLELVTGCTAGPESVAEAGPGATSRQSRATTQPAATTPLSGPDAIVTDWPAEASPEHGTEVWAIYLAVGPAGHPELAQASEYLGAHGYSAGEQELGCDVGAAEALRRDPREHAVAVYFEWRADAGHFLTLLKPAGSTPETSRGFVEMLRVERGCLD